MSVELNDITSGYSTGLINDNFQLVEDELNNNVLRRQGLATGEANHMEVGLDMNSNFVYNLPEPVLEHQAARLQDVQNAISGDTNQANLIIFTPYANISAANLQGAVQELADGTGHSLTTSTGEQSLLEALDDRVSIATSTFSLKKTTIADSSGTGLDYESEPQLVYCDNGDILCVYRRGSGHVTNDGRVVAKISSDLGRTWGSEFTIDDDASWDTRNPSAGKDSGSGRLVVFWRTIDASGQTLKDVYFSTSDDNGQTWSARTSILSEFPSLTNGDPHVPFGNIIETSLGTLAFFYAGDVCVHLRSNDGGQTWGSSTTVYDLSQVGATFTEPCFVSLDASRVVGIIRDDLDGTRYGWITSDDGGATWTAASVQDWTSGSINAAAPLWVQTVGDAEVVSAWYGRSLSYVLHSVRLSKEGFFARPRWAFQSGVEPVRRMDVSAADPSGTNAYDSEFGYPNLLEIPGVNHTVLCAWYDTVGPSTTRTAIYISTTPRY